MHTVILCRSRLAAALALLALAAGLALAAPGAWAAPEPEDPAKRTPWGLYLTAEEAYALKQEKGEQALFVDVRDPIEIMFTGFTDVVDRNVPFLLSDPSRWHDKKPVFKMAPNPDFADGVERALAAQGLDKSAPVILMCRSGGSRGAPSARALEGRGFERVYVVVDGFEGASVKDRPNGPWRLKNGWKNAGLPWSYALNREKMYFRQD
ncbi:MAG: rhodanese-like domain-containing protein [Marivibrio sp.]|uniref:rhodanese-like domain-containing protein n=1 Tax=Marivibrio sp. TaxID=2039719 RepID=UPI0032EE99ED